MNVNNVRIDNAQSKKYDFLMKVLRGEEYEKQQDIVKLKKSEKDSYITSVANNEMIYEAKIVKDEFVTETIVDLINFEAGVRYSGEMLMIGGVAFFKEQIPSVDLERCLDIKAEDNKVVIKSGEYYKYTDEQGESHIMACMHSHLSTPYSEQLKDTGDAEANKRGSFWNLLSEGSPYIGLYYTAEEEKQILNEAGITEGFFTVQVGSKKGEYFFAKGKYEHGAIPKYSYDGSYEYLTCDRNHFDEYDVGAVFLIDGEEYILDENKRLNIPYGIDVTDITYPPKTVKN